MDDIIRVLVVDDDPPVGDATRNQLTAAGDFDAYSAYTPDEAKAWLESNKTDFVVMDINLPGQNGISLAKHIRNAMGVIVPVLFISASLEDDSRAAIRKLGAAVGFLQKPFSKEDLLEAVTALLHKNELFTEVASMKSLVKEIHSTLKSQPPPLSAEALVEKIEADVCSKSHAKIVEEVKDGLRGDSARVAAGVAIRKFDGLIDKALAEAEGDSMPGRILAKIESRIERAVPTLLRAAAPTVVDDRVSAGYVWKKLTEGTLTKILLVAFFSLIVGFIHYMWADLQKAVGVSGANGKVLESVKTTQAQAVLPAINRLDRLPDQVQRQQAQMQEQSVHIQYQSERLANVDKTLQILAKELGKPGSTNPSRWGMGSVKLPTSAPLPARLPRLDRWKRDPNVGYHRGFPRYPLGSPSTRETTGTTGGP